VYGEPFQETILEEEELVLAHIYSYFDESGKEDSHKVVTYSGFVSTGKSVHEFQEKWKQMLREYKLTEFDAKKILRISETCGTMEKGVGAQDRVSKILPFIQAITNGLELGISVAVDVVAYKSLPALHKFYHPDPHYFAFYQVIARILRHFEIPVKYQIGLICDDEEKKATECYKLLKKMKLRFPEVHERVVSICFSDSGFYPVLQAAGLFATISRYEAEKRFFNKGYQWGELFEAFRKVDPQTGGHLHFNSGFYTTEDLSEHLQELRNQPEVYDEEKIK